MRYFDLEKLKAEDSVYSLYGRYLKDFGKEEGIYDEHIEKAYPKEYKAIKKTEAYIKEYVEHIGKYGGYYSHVLGFDDSYSEYLRIMENSHGIRDDIAEWIKNLPMQELFRYYESLKHILDPVLDSGKKRLEGFCEPYINFLKKSEVYLLGLLVNLGYSTDFKIGDSIYLHYEQDGEHKTSFTGDIIYKMTKRRVSYTRDNKVVKAVTGKSNAYYDKASIYVKRKISDIKVTTNSLTDIKLSETQIETLSEHLKDYDKSYNKIKKQLIKNYEK